MNITAVRFTGPVEGPDGKPIESLASAELDDGVIRSGAKRYPLHMVKSYTVDDACPICGTKRPERARGRTCGSKRCAAKLAARGKEPGQLRRAR